MKNRTKLSTTLCLLAGIITSAFIILSSAVDIGAISHTITVTYPYYAFVEDPNHPWSTVWDALDSTDTIDYSDEFFEEKSPGDHPELRAMSYALALAGYENQADGYPSTSTEANPKLKNLLDQIGFSDYESWDVSSDADGHSMGTTIGHKILENDQDLIVVAPRNYNYMTEWLSNFNLGTSGDHAGFSESASLIVSRLNQYLSTRDYHNYKIWMVGYSRGGAVIDLTAKAINQNLTNYDMESDDFYVYTFGAPRASATETNFDNIHDVKDGNDLLLGYVFPEIWGFYNTGTYEEIHPADLTITTSVIDITDLADGERAMNILASNNGVTMDVGTMNGKEFMDSWIQFVTANGLTREYFDGQIKEPLSALMQAYQLRTIDKQSEFTDFIKSTEYGIAGMVAGNAMMDFMTGGYASLDEFPPYQDIVKILQGTATNADVDDLMSYLTTYAGEYSDYEPRMGRPPTISEEEFAIIKENIPKLVKALAPMLIADARYTGEQYGDNYSLFYTYTLVSNAETLVIGHIPESIMPILKSLIPENDGPLVPDTGTMEQQKTSSENYYLVALIAIAPIYIILVRFIKKRLN
ncbi:hypothetical protein J6S35_00100 [Candidatus Saccharibacteria bacterium]|nr:hypothetical protein [Candidatus Saccharibacteria bacterium]